MTKYGNIQAERMDKMRLYEIESQERKKSVRLKTLSFGEKNYKVSTRIKEEQQKSYEKWLFIRNLRKEMQKNENKEVHNNR